MSGERRPAFFGEFAPTTLADLFRWLADYVDEDEATSFTGDDVYGAASRLREAIDGKLRAAEHIRGSRPPRQR